MLKRFGLILMLCAGLLVVGCGDDSDDSTTAADSAATATESTETTEATETAPSGKSAEQTKTKPVVKPPQGPPPKQLEKKDLVVGTGAEARPGDEVTVQYVGVNYATGTEFDSSWSRNEPFPFLLGAGSVIKGWDEGVVGMKVGGRRELIIPPDLAYGPEGTTGIEPNATLVFVIDLLDVK